MRGKSLTLNVAVLAIALLAGPGALRADVSLIEGDLRLFDGDKLTWIGTSTGNFDVVFNLGVPSQNVYGAYISWLSHPPMGAVKPSSVDFYFSEDPDLFSGTPDFSFNTAAWLQPSWTPYVDVPVDATGVGQYLKVSVVRGGEWLFVAEIVPMLTPPPTEWNVDVAGNWSYPSSWTAGVPTSTAIFGSKVTGPVAVNVDAPQSINKIVFDNVNAYTLSGSAITLTGTTPMIQAVTGSHEIAAPVVLGAATTVETASGTGVTLSGVVSGAALTKTGAGTLNLTNTGNTYSGTVLSGGELSIAGDGALGAVPASPETNISVRATASLRVPAAAETTLHANRNIDIAAGATLSPQTSYGGTLTIAGVVSGDGALNFSTWYAGRADGLYKLTGHNTYTGGTTISGDGYGTMALEVTADDNLGAVPASPATNITFGGGYAQRLRWGANFTLNANRSIYTYGTAEFDVNGYDVTLANKISGPGGPGIVSEGSLTLTNEDNDFTGNVYATGGGTLRGDSAGVWGRGTGNLLIIGNGSTVQAGASHTMSTFAQVWVDGGVSTIDTLDGVTLTVPAQVVPNSGLYLRKTGTGTLKLTNPANTADMVVHEGTMEVSSANSISVHSGAALKPGGVLTIATDLALDNANVNFTLGSTSDRIVTSTLSAYNLSALHFTEAAGLATGAIHLIDYTAWAAGSLANLDCPAILGKWQLSLQDTGTALVLHVISNMDMTASPAGPFNFGTVGVSTIATPQTVTLHNIGGSDVNITAATVTGGFAFADPLPGTPTYAVASEASVVYGIQLPGQTTPGHYAGTATFVTDIADGAGFKTFVYDLSADVVAHDGDVNGDGQVSLLDYNIIKVNFGNVYESGNHWNDGDVNGDGQVGLLDFNIVKAHFGHTTGDTGVTAVPEPATLSLLALAGLAALGRKR